MISHFSDTQRGIVLMLFASFLFALTMLFAKLLSSSIGSVEVTFWRNAIGLVVLGSFILKKPLANRGGKPFTLLFRGVIGTVALLAFFYTISATTLSNAIVYAKTEPIFTALLAYFVLKEKLPFSSLAAIVIGLIGVAVLSGLELHYLHVMGLLCGFLSALAYTSVRSLKTFYDERTVVFSFMLSGVLIPAFLMLFAEYITWDALAFLHTPFRIPSGFDWVWIVLMGIAAAYGQIFMTRAYFYAKAGIVSTISYSVVLFATVLGIVLGDTLPTPMVLAGGCLIIVSGIILSRQK